MPYPIFKNIFAKNPDSMREKTALAGRLTAPLELKKLGVLSVLGCGLLL